MGEEIRLNDIADELLILNKITIDKLFQLDNCSDCIALYVFYYKTAKWQKTNTIKANDVYVQKCLKWGRTKLVKTKNTLKEHGLIKIVQRRKDNKITGWYVEVSYLVAQKKTDDIKVKVEESKESQEQQVLKATSSNEETNALKEKIKCLEKEIKMLKEKKGKVFNPPTLEEIEQYCLERRNNIDAKYFYDFFTVNNWVDSKGNQVKNWKQKIITWEKNTRGGNNNASTKGTTKQDLSKYDR